MKPNYLTSYTSKSIYCLNCFNRVLLAASKHILTNTVFMRPKELMIDQEGMSSKRDQLKFSCNQDGEDTRCPKSIQKGERCHISVVPLGISTTLTSLGLDYFQTYFQFCCLEESPGNTTWFFFSPLPKNELILQPSLFMKLEDLTDITQKKKFEKHF